MKLPFKWTAWLVRHKYFLTLIAWIVVVFWICPYLISVKNTFCTILGMVLMIFITFRFLATSIESIQDAKEKKDDVSR
jgi:predicted membrane chloride channel (bestrophin family)